MAQSRMWFHRCDGKKENCGASATSETEFVAVLNENIYFFKLLAGSVLRFLRYSIKNT
jgi:hypothetical protein